MLCYAVNLEDDDGTVLVTAPDFPELTTFGDDRDEALMRAVDALAEAIAARIYDRKDIPRPTPIEANGLCVRLSTLTAVKVFLYQGMRDQNIGKAELARRLGWHLPQVDRVLNVNHHSRLDQMDAALNAIGLRLDVTSVAAPDQRSPMRKDAERVDELRDEYDFRKECEASTPRGIPKAQLSRGKSGIGRTGDGTLAIS